MCRPNKHVWLAAAVWLKASRCRRSLPKPAHPAAPAPIFRLTSWRRSSQLSMCDVNESQPGDAGNQQPPRSEDEAASASNGVGRTHQGLCTITDAPSVVDSLASDHSGVQHLTTLLGQSASDLDLQVMKLKAERAEMKRDKTRLSAQLRNTERTKRNASATAPPNSATTTSSRFTPCACTPSRRRTPRTRHRRVDGCLRRPEGIICHCTITRSVKVNAQAWEHQSIIHRCVHPPGFPCVM